MMKTKIRNIIMLLGIFSCLTPTLISQNASFYSERFESLSDFSNWSQEKTSGSALWTLNNGLPYGDFNSAFDGQSNACFASYNYNEDQTILVSPTIDLSSAIYPILKFHLLQPIWSSDQDELQVLYRSDISNDWTILSSYNYDISTWTEMLVALPDASETYQIAFSAKSGYGYGIGLDNISISNGDTCDMIKNFNFITIKETSILISWENQGNNTYEIEYGPIGYLPGNGIRVNNINTKSTHINNLNAGEGYSLYVRVYCSNGISDWKGPYDFYTECNIAQQIPYIESFENTENALECWGVIYPSNYHNPENEIVVLDETAYSGQNSLRFSSYKVGSPYDQYLISPNFSFEDTLELSFKYKTINGSQELFKVGFSTNSDNPLNEVNWLDTVSNADADWKTYKTLVPPGSSNFVLHYCSIFEYYLFIDDVKINYPGQCDIAENVVVSNITETSAIISWESEADFYEIEYGFANTNKGKGKNIAELNHNQIELTNLIPGMDYSAYIITKCGGVKLYSDVINFTTLQTIECNPINQIYSEQITPNSAIIKWISEEGNSSWNAEYGLSGFSLGEGDLIENLTENFIQLTDLTNNTKYDIYVQAYCNESSELTNWSEKFSFTTPELHLELDDTIIIPQTNPEAILVAVDSIIYICNNTDSNITTELEFINTGKVVITAGSKITYSIVIESNNEIIHIEKTLTNDIMPSEKCSFIDKLDVTNISNLEYLSIQLTENWKSSNSQSDHITIASIFNSITFNNEINSVIEVANFPSLISAEFFSNIEQYNIDYLWNDNTCGDSRFVNNEGIYTLTVSTEFCQISKSVNVIKKADEFQNQTQYDVYPNPSQDGQINLSTNSETNINVIIYDAVGRNVYATTLSNIVKHVDLSFLAAGIYNVAFIDNDNVELKRLYIN
ncbi:MAG: fibronectin type III domain-containing protein [Bacteroidales bacterium]|nr:fibronectin type III domain-containing protein [Bacteroidales bacterium]